METTETFKSPFDQHTLQYFMGLLLEKRREAEEEEQTLEENLYNINEDNDTDQSSVTQLMGNFGYDTEEKQMTYQLLERTRKYINQINNALERIDDGSYGLCKATGKPISKARLVSVPQTRNSIEVKEKRLDHE